MGTNKAWLPLNGTTMIERARKLLERVCEKVCILGAPEFYGQLGECHQDIYPDCGPLGGIHVALLNSRTELNLITAVDTPFLSEEFLNYMIERARNSSAVVTTPSVGGYDQPLCAVYSRRFLPVAEAALKSGQYKIVPLFSEVDTLVLREQELGQFALSAGMFDNVNTPEDYQSAQKRLASQPKPEP